MKKIIITIFLILVIGAIVAVAKFAMAPEKEPTQNQNFFDPKNSSFTVEDAPVTLSNGVSEVELASIPGAKITTRYFGNEARGDLNFDGKDDVAYLITQDGGGSGLFYYAVVALKTESGYKTTNAFFVGDRIAPQTTEIQSQTGELRVNFAERKPGEPMSAQPSVGAVTLLKVTPEGVLEGLLK